MHGVGPGSTLGGRYAISRRTQEHSRYERWTAHDQTLERDVVLLCFPALGSTAAAGLDAARRAAGVDEARLVRVLDVGIDHETAFVVEEPLSRAVDLVDLLDAGPLPASEVRRLVGEAATALERARVRGLHHGVLGPRSLLRADDGAVKVRGLAVEGALLGLDDVDGARASRDDTVALVALAYAALTGCWPLMTPVGPHDGLPAAPTAVGGIVSPAEITAGVPADLDTIARLTLGGASDTADTAGGGGSSAGGRGPLTPGDLASQIAPWPLAVDPSHLSGPFPSAAPVAASDPAPAAARATGGKTVLGMPLDADDTPRGGGADTDSLDLPDVRVARAHASAGAPAAAASVPAPVAAPVAATGKGRGRDPMRMTAHVRLSDTLEETDDDLEPPLPVGVRRTPAAPTADRAGTALAVVAALVVVAAALGIVGVSRIGHSSSPTPAGTASATASASPSTATPTSSASTSATSTAPALTPIGIVQAQAWDPQGDNQEGNASAPRSFDGDPSTMWRSQTYRSAPFGGLAKTGIGLILDLGQQQTVKQVQVDLRGGSDLTVYVASRESLDGATAIGTSAGVDGTVTVTAPSGGVRGQLVILWFTGLAPDGEGGFRAQVAEARVGG